MNFTFEIDPSSLSTAQQKVMNFHTKSIITNPRVAKAMRIVKAEALKHTQEVLDMYGDGEQPPVELYISFKFPYPKSLTKRQREKCYEGEPVTSARYGDLDNRAKAFIDALVLARWIKDDRYISNLILAKVYTIGTPRISVSIRSAYSPAQVVYHTTLP